VAAALAMALAAAGARAQQQQDIGWPEAVARLAAERQRAVTCASLARALPPGAATAPLGAAYDEAKSEMDGVVAGLAVALAQGSGRGAPGAALPDLERRLEAGFARFCQGSCQRACLAGRGTAGRHREQRGWGPGMDCVCCGSAAVAERPERTTQGYRRFRCRDCGRQFNRKRRVETLLRAA
jgi:hypothetical protein